MSKAAMPLALMANIGMLLFYSFVTFKLSFHTDAATKSVLANEILSRGELFPDGWCYVNNDVWVFLTHIFLVPLIRLFGLNYLSYALNNILFYCLYGLSIYFFLRKSTISGPSKILVATLAISSLSFCYAAFIFGEIAYITIYAFIFLFLGLSNRVIHSPEGELKKYYLGLSVLVSIFTLHNPQRALIYNLLPVLLVSLYLYFMGAAQRKKCVRMALAGGVSFACSAVFNYAIITNDLTIIKGANNLLFADYDRVLSHVNIFFFGLLDVFNLVGQDRFSPFSFAGIVRLASFCFFFLIVCAFIKTPKKFDLEKIDALIACLLLVYYLFVNLFLYIFTSPLAQDETTFKYFYPAVLLSFIVMVFFLNDVHWPKPLKTAIFALLVLFLSASNFERYVSPSFSKEANPHERLGAYLSESGLAYGFATFWNSYVTTVFADNDALVAPVYMEGFVPMRWLSSDDWYRNHAVDKSFVVFAGDEFEDHYDGIIRRVGKDPVRIDQVDDFKIAVFDKNIAYELTRTYRSSLRQGIDFTIKGYPGFIKALKGFSGYEPSHRWSDGKRSTLIFNEKLPESFDLVFSGFPFAAAENNAMSVVVGPDERRVDVGEGFQNYRLTFKGVDTDRVEFVFKKPLSPFELNMSMDKRKLSFAFNAIKIKRTGGGTPLKEGS